MSIIYWGDVACTPDNYDTNDEREFVVFETINLAEGLLRVLDRGPYAQCAESYNSYSGEHDVGMVEIQYFCDYVNHLN